MLHTVLENGTLHGMHKWEYTPTYRGFDSFYGYYNAAEDYFNHSVVRKHSALDFRNNTKPVRDKNGVYSRIDMSSSLLKKHPTLVVATYILKWSSVILV